MKFLEYGAALLIGAAVANIFFFSPNTSTILRTGFGGTAKVLGTVEAPGGGGAAQQPY